jgi:hypothetical protein
MVMPPVSATPSFSKALPANYVFQTAIAFFKPQSPMRKTGSVCALKAIVGNRVTRIQGKLHEAHGSNARLPNDFGHECKTAPSAAVIEQGRILMLRS